MEDRGRPGLNNPAIRARLTQTHRRVGPTTPTFQAPQQLVKSQPLPVVPRPSNLPQMNIVSPQPLPRPAHPKQQQSKVLRRQSVRKPLEIAVNYDPQYVEVARPQRKSRNLKPKVKFAVVGLVALSLLVGVGSLVNGIIGKDGKSSAGSNVDFTVIEEASDPTKLSELRPTANALSSYIVPDDNPKIITIPKLFVYSRIKPVGLTANNQLNLTNNIFDAGWLNASGKPGTADKNVIIINGHSAGPNQLGLFAKLGTLQVGDSIKITRGDGQPFVYNVVKVQIVEAGNADPTMMSMPAEAGKAGLNLISCDENLSSEIGECRQQVIVYASKSS